jgi:hypothetical protein
VRKKTLCFLNSRFNCEKHVLTSHAYSEFCCNFQQWGPVNHKQLLEPVRFPGLSVETFGSEMKPLKKVTNFEKHQSSLNPASFLLFVP